MPMQEAAPIGRDTFPPTRYSCPSQALGCEGRPAVPRPPMLRREPSSDPPRHDPRTDAVSRGDGGPSVAQVFRNHLICYTCTGFGTDPPGKPSPIPREFRRIDVSGRALGQDEMDSAIQTTSTAKVRRVDGGCGPVI